MTDEIRVRLAASRADYDACVELQRTVWGLSDLEITSAVQFIGGVQAGGLLQIAETADGQPAGFAYALAGLRGGTPHFHSDMLAVMPAHRARGVGVRLKWAQREEALARGVSLVTWSYDPLQARNAHLNLRRLGATATEFLPNLYGITSASLHHGLPTDRLLVRWELQHPRVVQRAQENDHAAPVTIPEEMPRINEVKWQAGWPVSSDPDLERTENELLLEIPPEWDVLVHSAPRVAESWQQRVRRALQHYLGAGWHAAEFLHAEENGRRRPLYLLRRG